MIKKISRYLILGIGLYVLTASLVIFFYKDSPTSMDWQDRQSYNNRFILNLSANTPMYLETVLTSLGTPDITFAKSVEEHTYQIVYYRTQHVKSDGITTKEECTGLVFKNNLLVAWGPGSNTAYDNTII